VALVVAYGRILPEDVLAGPRLGSLNVHASILPKYRGAAPIAWAIVRGEKETGVCLMQMDVGMDTGPVLETRTTPIGGEETAGELSKRLSALGAIMVRESLPRFVRGELTSTPQDHAQATTAPILTKEHGRIDWAQDAQRVHDLVRGMNPWPMAFTHHAGKRIIVHATRIAGAAQEGKPGQVILADKARVLVACAESRCVELVRVQLEGKKPMGSGDWFLGRGVKEGDVLGQ
jgi:methionyl-tRNA formyltransferase